MRLWPLRRRCSLSTRRYGLSDYGANPRILEKIAEPVKKFFSSLNPPSETGESHDDLGVHHGSKGIHLPI